jgi:hypothetical protein
MNTFGYNADCWMQAKEEARQILIQVATRRGSIAYSELAPQIQSIPFEHDAPRFWHLLGEISIEENAQGRGMLSALVVHKHGDMLPGPGFFALAKHLGKTSKKQVETLWLDEFKKAHDTWANRK